MSMDSYRYETENERLDIKPSGDPRNTFIWVHESTKEAAIIIPNADIPAVAAELLKAAGQESVIVAKSKAEVRERVGHIVCGSDPVAAVVGLNQRDTSELREKAANYIALAEYIEDKDQREAEAEKKLQERRDALARNFSPLSDPYEMVSVSTQKAIDRIINLEDGK